VDITTRDIETTTTEEGETMNTNSTDVLVVGAGPAGLVAAAELARHGVAVRVVDKLAKPTDESRAIAVHARSLDMLARMGTVDRLIDTGVKAGGMELFSGHDKLLRVPLDSVDAAYPFSLNTPQTETERVLDEHLQSLGVSVERSVELVGLTQDADAVSVTLEHADGNVEALTVGWVIGADGARSPVRHLVGGKLEGTFVGERFLLGDVDAEHDLDDESMYTFFSPDGPVLAMPMRGGRTRVMAQVHDAPGTPLNLHPTLEQLQKVIDDRIGRIKLVRGHWLTSFELHHAQVSQYRWGRVFLVGDSAHVHSPAGGQGMNTGMQDAYNLVWKLAAVTKGQAGEGLLDSYQAERHPVAESMIEFTDRLSKAGTLTGGPQRVRNAMLKLISHVDAAPRAMARLTAEVTVNYQGSPIVSTHGLRGTKVSAGDHFPYLGDADVQKQVTNCWGLDHTTVTVAAGQATPAVGSSGQQVLISDHDTPVAGYDIVIADPQRSVARRLGLRSGGRVVVRPDTYIGVIAGLDDSDTIARYFSTIAR
jgi:2-polyprenyl-6-methoxyphenol hydroxylase-like FAD-dependent oxidoreductase